MTAAALWSSVVANYDNQTLVELTNQSATGETAINNARGESAAQEVIDLWPSYAQEVFDVTNAAALPAARHGVIAVLWMRGGSAQEVGRVEWDRVFGSGGMVEAYLEGEARARVVPKSTTPRDSLRRKVEPWSSRQSLPHGLLPNQRTRR